MSRLDWIFKKNSSFYKYKLCETICKIESMTKHFKVPLVVFRWSSCVPKELIKHSLIFYGSVWSIL